MTPCGTVRRMTADDLAQVLRWRNHPDIRAFMFTQHEISPEEHALWFAKADADPARHLLIYEVDGEPLGFASLARRGEPGAADWGFYLAPGAPRGSGTGLGAAVLDHAFAVLRLDEVRGEALAFNTASIRMHERLGFRREGERRQPDDGGGGEHAVICFGLRRDEWLGTVRPAGAWRHRHGDPKP
jgi:UDP-4-amino-4,6-dideoxy-N-acetyl-beta-L-altrosamine N-acetyltransferase